MTGERVTISATVSRTPGIAFILKKAAISALVAFVLFSLMIGMAPRLPSTA